MRGMKVTAQLHALFELVTERLLVEEDVRVLELLIETVLWDKVSMLGMRQGVH